MGLYSYFKNSVKRKVIKQVVLSLGDASSENLIRIGNLLERITSHKTTLDSVKAVKRMVKEKHPSITLIRRILKEMHPNCRDKFVENFIINGLVINSQIREKIEKTGNASPFSILISPTMRCNLNCVGCYAGNYSKKDDLEIQYFDKIVIQGEEMGVAVFTILGGEPLVVKDELFKICKKHNRSYFQVYTNGCLITESVAEEIVKLGNIFPVISIEGYEKETDNRRGKGVYDKVTRAMEILKKYKIPFGYSVAVTSKNAELVSSDKFLDMMIDRGAYIGWHFLYMPIGQGPDLKLMPTPKQRKMLRDRWVKVRASKPLFVVDFWNDAPYVGGCIAGRYYIHINSKGDVEPCIFSHFAVDNIKNKSLSQVMNSGFFKELRRRQPYSDNLYMPCMWIDSPEVGKEIVEKYHCYPTHSGAETIIKDKKLRAGLFRYSKEVKKQFDPIWKEEQEKKRKRN